jgi:hypothetical protein
MTDVKLVLSTEDGTEIDLIVSHVNGKSNIKVDVDDLILDDGAIVVAALGMRGINQAIKGVISGELRTDNPHMHVQQEGELL